MATKRQRHQAAIVWAAFTVFGGLRFAYKYLDDRANGIVGTARPRALEEFTGAYAGLLIFLVVYWLVRRHPIRAGAWRKPLAIYLAAMPALAAVDTTLMLYSREALAPLLGLGRYDYGNLWFRYPMEFSMEIVFYLMMIAVLVLADFYRLNQQRERDLARAELANLRLQLQPHFLFNALNTISAVMYEDVARADTMLQRLSELLRRALTAGELQEVPLAEELTTARLYMELQQARFEEKLRVEFEIAAGAEQVLVPHLVLQPLLENAVKHGGGVITVRAAREEGALALEVRNSVRASAAADGHGIGLRNTAQRLARLYGREHRFDFGPEGEGGFAVRLAVPYRA